jgi:hypothetical protein
VSRSNKNTKTQSPYLHTRISILGRRIKSTPETPIKGGKERKKGENKRESTRRERTREREREPKRGRKTR